MPQPYPYTRKEAPWLESDGAMIEMLAAARTARNGLRGGYGQEMKAAMGCLRVKVSGLRVWGLRL